MREFFRGWRRMVGVITLVMACLFVAGWLRSWESADELEFRCDNHTLIWFVSCYDWMGCGIISRWTETPFHNSRRTRWTSASRSAGNGDAFQGLDFYLEGRVSHPYLVLPYSVVVVPLTLAALWLLLYKPHKSTQSTRSVNRSSDHTGIYLSVTSLTQRWPSSSPLIMFVVVGITSVLLGVLSWFVVERPFLKKRAGTSLQLPAHNDMVSPSAR